MLIVLSRFNGELVNKHTLKSVNGFPTSSSADKSSLLRLADFDQYYTMTCLGKQSDQPPQSSHPNYLLRLSIFITHIFILLYCAPSCFGVDTV